MFLVCRNIVSDHSENEEESLAVNEGLPWAVAQMSDTHGKSNASMGKKHAQLPCFSHTFMSTPHEGHACWSLPVVKKLAAADLQSGQVIFS